MTKALIRDINRFVSLAPIDLCARICALLQQSRGWDRIIDEIPILVFETELQQLLLQISETCRAHTIGPSEVLLAFEVGTEIEIRHRNEPRLELIWSGPAVAPFRLRRTDETLLQLIEEARSNLTLVSFALYRIDRLTQALRAAVIRGVQIRMFIESIKTNESDLNRLYSNELAASIEFFCWSDTKRLQSKRGDYGVLHAKAAIADREKILISSANLTEHALTLNMEMGILVQGGELPKRAERIFSDFVSNGIFSKFQVQRD